MLNGLEVVLPTGEVVRIGSCAISKYWFARAPLPDLAGLFLGWAGTTGVRTKLAIKLYPSYRFNDVGVFVCEDATFYAEDVTRIHAPGYSFNRADTADVARAQKALEKTNQAVVALGGIPWKAEAPAQKEIISKMDPNMFALMNRIRAVLDPNGIMNPGNWEVD